MINWTIFIIIWNLYFTFLHCTSLNNATVENNTSYTIIDKVKESQYSTEKFLTKMIIDKYKRIGTLGLPVNHHNDTMNVKYGLALIQIISLNEKYQVLTLNCWSRYTWIDINIQWNEKIFDNITIIRLPVESVWIPDIVLYNYADERLNEMRKTSVLVDSGGNVLWIPQGMFKSTCAIDIKYFPFDTQICVLKFGSWSHDGRTLDLNFYQDLNSLDLNDFTRSNEWDIIGHSAIKNTKLYPCCVNPYIDITFTIKIKRKFTHFVYILLLPCILLSTLTMLMFWIPPESQHKMILGMNLFVAYFVLLMLLADHTPISSNSVPIIGIYFCLNMVLITLSNFLSIMVINLYLMNNVYFTYMPKFVETIFIKILGQYLCPSLLKTLHQYVAESFNARIKSEEASAIIFNKIRKKKVMETPPLKRKPFNKLKKVEKRCDTSFNSPLLESINDAWNFSTSLNTLKPKRYQTTNNKAGKSEYSSISLQNLATQKVENQHYPKKISQLNSHLKLNMDINPHHKNLTKRKASNMFSSKSSYDIQNNYNPKLISDIESPNINCIGKSRKLREQLLIKQIKEIKNAIINVVDNETRQSLNQKNIQVWRIVAIVLDRIFFISYFMIISVTTIIACILNELND